MNYNDLLTKSKWWLEQKPAYIAGTFSMGIFSKGAKWMHERLNESGGKKTVFNNAINFGGYGLLKYGICTVAFSIAAMLLYKIDIFLMPLSIIVFYCCEVQFLFLFPLLIDNVENPVWMSVQQTWRIGMWKALCTVIPISIFMMIGLFNLKAPFRNWHTGSLAIIIWYQYEVRNRIQ